jgi:hypothetical protein
MLKSISDVSSARRVCREKRRYFVARYFAMVTGAGAGFEPANLGSLVTYTAIDLMPVVDSTVITLGS